MRCETESSKLKNIRMIAIAVMMMVSSFNAEMEQQPHTHEERIEEVEVKQ